MENSRFIFAIMGCYLMGVGVFTGMLIEDIRFDESRSALLTQLENDTSTLHKRLIAIERGYGHGQRDFAMMQLPVASPPGGKRFHHSFCSFGT